MAIQGGPGGNCGPGNTWSCQTIDSAGDVGQYSSLAVAPGTSGSSLKFGIAYYDSTNKTLKFYRYACTLGTCGSNVYTIAVSPIADNGKYASLKYDANGIAHIAYQVAAAGPTYYLWHAYEVPSGGNCGTGAATGEWQCEVIDSGSGIGQYAAIGVNGTRPSIAYYDGLNGDLKLAFQQPQIYLPLVTR